MVVGAQEEVNKAMLCSWWPLLYNKLLFEPRLLTGLATLNSAFPVWLTMCLVGSKLNTNCCGAAGLMVIVTFH